MRSEKWKVRRAKKRKGIEARKVKHPTPSRATDALIGYAEQNGKQKRTKRKKQGAGPLPATLDHSVAFYDAQVSYGELILSGRIRHRWSRMQ